MGVTVLKTICSRLHFQILQKQTRVVATLREVWRAHCCRRRDLAMSSKSKQQQQLRASRLVLTADDCLRYFWLVDYHSKYCHVFHSAGAAALLTFSWSLILQYQAAASAATISVETNAKG